MLQYSKRLSPNDVGETGGHQAGVAVPKSNIALLSFLPPLNLGAYNPEAWLTCVDEYGQEFAVRLVYYNGKTLSPPRSSRNEYRLTHLTGFFRKFNAKSGDELRLGGPDDLGRYTLKLVQSSNSEMPAESPTRLQTGVIVLKGWQRVC